MGFENAWTKAIDRLKQEKVGDERIIVHLGERIKVLRNESDAKDELVTSLRTGIETLEKANLLLENNLRILHLSVDP